MSYSNEDLTAWFWDFLGLSPSKDYKKKYEKMSFQQQKEFRKRKAARVYSKEDRATLSNRGFVRGVVNSNTGRFMTRRKEKGLGTYKNEKFVINQPEKFKELFYKNYSELSEISGNQKKLPRSRDNKGRFI
jgi:hypothetical protein